MRGAFLALLMLGACGGNAARQELPAPQLPQRAGVDPTVAARAEGIEFRAVGDGFVLDIFRADRIRITLTEPREELTFAKPEPTYPRWHGSIYDASNEAHSVHIEIQNYRPCERDDRAAYPISVEVVLDGREMAACGRSF